MEMMRLDADAPEPNVAGHFSSWVSWEHRQAIPDDHGGYVHKYGGVYLLAHFASAPPQGPADVLHDAIVYVGEGKHLKQRWYQFERSAYLGLSGHSGGASHRTWREQSRIPWETLHVAAFPIWFASEGTTDAPASLARRFRLYVEQLLLWKLAVHRREHAVPLLNAK